MIEDWLCLTRARSGDESAWRSLFDRHYESLAKLAFFITGSLEGAQDIAQEAFVSLLRMNIRHQDGSLKALLTTIVYRQALKERARQRPLKKLSELSVADDSPSMLDMAIADETDKLIVRSLLALGVEYREVLTLRFFGGHSYEEIASIVDIPIGTVKSRIFYAIKACREDLKRQGVFL